MCPKISPRTITWRQTVRHVTTSCPEDWCHSFPTLLRTLTRSVPGRLSPAEIHIRCVIYLTSSYCRTKGRLLKLRQQRLRTDVGTRLHNPLLRSKAQPSDRRRASNSLSADHVLLRRISGAIAVKASASWALAVSAAAAKVPRMHRQAIFKTQGILMDVGWISDSSHGTNMLQQVTRQVSRLLHPELLG